VFLNRLRFFVQTLQILADFEDNGNSLKRDADCDCCSIFAFVFCGQLQSTLQACTIKGMVTATEAAKKIGCSTATVSRWAKVLGFQLKYGNSLLLTEKQVKKIESTWKRASGNPNFGKKDD
jgi:hypothetical protein